MNPRLLRPLATGFNPRSISGLLGWWDAADASSVTLNGTTVSEWRDKSGNALHATQVTAANQPLYTEFINDRRSITFGNPRAFAITSTALSAYSWIGVSFPTGNVQMIFGGLNGTHLPADATATSPFFNYDGVFGQVGTGTSSTAVIQCATRTSAGLHAFFRNGSNVTSGTPTNTTTATIEFIGARNFGVPSPGHYTGRVGELMLFSAALSATDRNRIERYLSRKWNIALA
jgi:hypothetical protein